MQTHEIPSRRGVLLAASGLADCLVPGGDCPVANLDPIDFLDTAERLTDQQRGAIAGCTALALLGDAVIAHHHS